MFTMARLVKPSYFRTDLRKRDWHGHHRQRPKNFDTVWEIAFHLQECASRKSSGAFDHCAPLRCTAEPGQRRFD